MLRAGGAVLSPQSFSATDNGLVQRCRLSESRTSWSDIEAVEEDSDYLYFFHDRGVATIIPRRVFPTRTAYNEFVALVRSYVAPSEIKGG